MLGSGELLYIGMRVVLVGLWLMAALAAARFTRQLDARPRRLALCGTVLLVLPAAMSAYDIWDNAVARPLDPVGPGSWVWLVFDGLAPIFCLLLLRTLDERNAAQEALRTLAATDPLTGLANRRGFFAQVTAPLAAARRQGQGATLLLLDLDRFKAINDACGHPAGDEVLRHAAAVLRGVLRASDLPVRWGGEEFAVLLPFTTPAEAATLAERLRLALRAKVPHPAGGDAVVTASFGLAPVGGDGAEAALAQAIRDADRALYRAKAGGRDRVVIDMGEPDPLVVPGLAWVDPNWRTPAYRTT
ncbi:GGDEF domain-containing protein [Dankookia sp. P2]|uniref:GGDEF domain-containing protein n=1 Tax=Dankookia sp. P2 TaxID=3423955 RepID=UPI003D67090A